MVAEAYLKEGKTPIVNVMHTYPYQLKRLLDLSGKEGIELITMLPDQKQERIRNGSTEIVDIHDGVQWFAQNFWNDNIHGVPPEKVDSFSKDFVWQVTPEQIRTSKSN